MKFKKTNKFNAKKVVVDNIKFDSIKESMRYLQLKILKASGEVKDFIMQYPFKCKSGIKYICDFRVEWKNGEVTYEDTKGVLTAVFKLKKKLVEHEFPVKITVL